MKLKSGLVAALVAVSWFIPFGLIFDSSISYAQIYNESGSAAGQAALGQSGESLQLGLSAAAADDLASIQTLGSDATERVTVTSIQILYRNGTPIGGDDSISTDEKIMIRYDFSVAESVSAGDTAIFPLPDAISIKAALEAGIIPVPLDDDPEAIIAYVELRENPQQLILTFTGLIDSLDEVEAAFFAFSGNFDGEQLGEGGKQTIVFEVTGGTVEIDLTFRTIALEVQKESIKQYQEEGDLYLVWEITANPEKLGLYDLQLTDILPAGLELYGYQFAGSPAETLPEGWEMKKNGQNIIFSCQGLCSDKVVITLTTKVADLSLSPVEGYGFPVVNEVEAQANDGKGSALGPDTDQASTVIDTTWLKKTGAVAADNAYAVAWTLTINTEELYLQNVVLVDTLPAGLALDKDSIHIQSKDGSQTLTLGGGVELTEEIKAEGTLYRFAFGDIRKCYVITYNTIVTDKITENQKETYKNNAYLIWEVNGKGHETKPIEAGVDVANTVLRKSSDANYPKRQMIKWRLSVNESKNEITEQVTVTDTLLDGQTFREGSLEVRIGSQLIGADSGVYGFQLSPEKDSFQVVFAPGTLNGAVAYISFEANLDHLTLAKNGKPNFQNKANLAVEGGVTLNVTATQGVEAEVLEKKLAAYDGESKAFSWQLTVNGDFLSGLGTVTVTDTLPEQTSFAGMEIYEGERVTVYGRDTVVQGNRLEQSGYEYNLSEDGKKVVITFSKEALDGKAAIIHLRTAIDETFFHQNQEQTPFINSAQIEIEQVHSGDITVTAKGNASSSLVSKSGSFNAEEDEAIRWAVMVNGSGMEWDLSGATLTDHLQEGLALDIETVKLEQYLVDADTGGFSYLGEIPLEYGANVGYQPATNEFVFTFPTVKEGYAYKLLFSTDVLESGSYENTILFRGQGSMEEDSKATVTVDLNDSSAGAIATRKARITLEKFAADNRDLALPGAVFELRDSAGTLLETAATDDEGRIAFSYWLRYETAYSLHEVEAPAGYTQLGEPVKVWMEKNRPETLVYHVANERIIGGVEVTKTSPDKSPLAGVEFTLYNSDNEKVEGIENPAKTGADGIVRFAPLPYGEYYLVETAAPDNVVLDGTAMVFAVNSQGQVVRLSLVNQLRESSGEENGGKPEGPGPEKPEPEIPGPEKPEPEIPGPEKPGPEESQNSGDSKPEESSNSSSGQEKESSSRPESSAEEAGGGSKSSGSTGRYRPGGSSGDRVDADRPSGDRGDGETPSSGSAGSSSGDNSLSETYNPSTGGGAKRGAGLCAAALGALGILLKKRDE